MNAWATYVWLAMIIIAAFFGWYYSVAFIAACSIYANFTGHLAAWRADDFPQGIKDQLDRIEAELNSLSGILAKGEREGARG